MGKKKLSPEKRRKKAEKARSFQEQIKARKVADNERSTRSRLKIPKEAALPNLGEDDLRSIAKNSYSLVFAHYNHSTCDLARVDRRSKSLVFLLDKMSRATPSTKHELVRNNIKRNEASGQYKNLFSKLPKDIEYLSEADFGDEARVFFYTLENLPKNYLGVVSINPFHLKK